MSEFEQQFTKENRFTDGLMADQLDLFVLICDFIENREGKPQYAVVSAPAGTGKTFTARRLIQYFKAKGTIISTATFTGRASLQISKDGIDGRTTHSLLYKPILDENGDIIEWDSRSTEEIKNEVGNVLFIDEGSMIPKKIHNDLSILGIPIVYLGDYDQLPPVDNSNPDFNPMTSLGVPRWTLHKNNRFDENSGIGFMANHLRNENSIPRVKFDDLRIIPKTKIQKVSFHEDNHFDAIICGTNKMRKSITEKVRKARGYDSETAEIGETIICLRNDVISGIDIANGETFIVEGKFVLGGGHTSYSIRSVDDPSKALAVTIEDHVWETEKSRLKLNDTPKVAVFTFGYAMTVHKCVHPDTLVLTDEGLLPIKNIKFEGNVAIGGEMRPYCNFVENPYSDGLAFVTERGYDIKNTNDHNMLILRDGEWNTIPASDVREGDWVKMSMEYSTDHKEQNLDENDCNFNIRTKIFETPKILTKDVSEFVGLLLADGCIYKSGFRVCKIHKDVTDKFTKWCYDFFGFSNSEKLLNVNGGSDFYNSEVNSVFLREWILLNFPELTPNNKGIPEKIMRSPVEHKKAFIRGLFEDACVNIKKNKTVDHIQFCNKSKNVVDWVHVFLLSMGIPATKAYRNGNWNIYIYGIYCKVYREKIGFISKFKQSRLYDYAYAKNDTRSRVPLTFSEQEELSPSLTPSERSSMKKNGYLSKYIISKYSMIGDKWFFDRINGVENEKIPSMCLEVPDGNKFLQNGQLHGNCQGSSIEKVLFIDQDVSFFLDQRRFRYTACSRASQELTVAV